MAGPDQIRLIHKRFSYLNKSDFAFIGLRANIVIECNKIGLAQKKKSHSMCVLLCMYVVQSLFV